MSKSKYSMSLSCCRQMMLPTPSSSTNLKQCLVRSFSVPFLWLLQALSLLQGAACIHLMTVVSSLLHVRLNSAVAGKHIASQNRSRHILVIQRPTCQDQRVSVSRIPQWGHPAHVQSSCHLHVCKSRSLPSCSASRCCIHWIWLPQHLQGTSTSYNTVYEQHDLLMLPVHLSA